MKTARRSTSTHSRARRTRSTSSDLARVTSAPGVDAAGSARGPKTSTDAAPGAASPRRNALRTRRARAGSAATDRSRETADGPLRRRPARRPRGRCRARRGDAAKPRRSRTHGRTSLESSRRSGRQPRRGRGLGTRSSASFRDEPTELSWKAPGELHAKSSGPRREAVRDRAVDGERVAGERVEHLGVRAQ